MRACFNSLNILGQRNFARVNEALLWGLNKEKGVLKQYTGSTYTKDIFLFYFIYD